MLAEIMRPARVSHAQIAGFLIALRTKGETVGEIAGLARTMRALAAPVTVTRDALVDTAGTGGGRSTFNVSTTAALIAAATGCAVAKHGNRSATSRSGSADLLEALGARIDLAPEQVARCIDEVGFGFMFAPAHHQATRFVVPVRRDLGVRTIFNFLGPLTNPAARAASSSVSATAPTTRDDPPARWRCSASIAPSLSQARTGSTRSPQRRRRGSSRSTAIGSIATRYDAGRARPRTSRRWRARGRGDPAYNAGVTRAIFAGQAGGARELALANAGATIYAARGGRRLCARASARRVRRSTMAARPQPSRPTWPRRTREHPRRDRGAHARRTCRAPA